MAFQAFHVLRNAESLEGTLVIDIFGREEYHLPNTDNNIIARSDLVEPELDSAMYRANPGEQALHL